MANRRYQLKYNQSKDGHVIARLDSQTNIQDYIRRLVLSDIAADGLRDLVQFDPSKPDLHDYCKYCKYDSDYDQNYPANCAKTKCPQFDLDEFREIQRQDFYNEYCDCVKFHASVNGKDSEFNYCLFCKFYKGCACTIEDAFDEYFSSLINGDAERRTDGE